MGNEQKVAEPVIGAIEEGKGKGSDKVEQARVDKAVEVKI